RARTASAFRNRRSIFGDSECKRGSQLLRSSPPGIETVHDYEFRLDSDSMLRRATLLSSASEATVGVRSLCIGTWRGAFLALETEYIPFERGRVAAVKLTNHPLFFRHFAATIEHSPIDERRSRTTYLYSFKARPRFLAPLLEPIMNV